MANALLLALAMMGQAAAQPSSAPADEYGYVSWCYGALGGYLDLYDQAMPEVTRIEKAFPGPDGVNAALKTYPEMRAQARIDMKTYGAAMTAAEKASPRPISDYGRASVQKGRSVWSGSTTAGKARLAQIWMSWSPPGDCEKRAKTLEMRSNVLGKALIYNSATAAEIKTGEKAPEPAPQTAVETAAPAAAPAAAPPEAPAPTPAVETPAPAVTKASTTPAAKPAAKPSAAPVKPAVKPAATTAKAPVQATPKPPAKATTVATAKPATPPAAKPAGKAEFVVDFNDPKPCPGRLDSVKRGGKDVLVCKPD